MRGVHRFTFLLVAILTVAPFVTAAPPDAARTSAARGVRGIVAHRGSSADRPENTLASYRRAIEAGADAIEIDLRLTKDGHLVSLHDDSLDRTTEGTGPVESITLAEARQLDAGVWFDERYRGERIPTFREILELSKGHIQVFLDLKDGGGAYARQVVEDVRRWGDPPRTILGVRSVEAAIYYRQQLPEALQVGLIPNANDIERFVAAGVKVIRLWPKWLLSDATSSMPAKQLLDRVRESGALLLLNVEDGSAEPVKAALLAKPEYLFTDDPGKLRRTLADLE